MPKFGEYQTIDEPVAMTEGPGYVSVVWKAQSSIARDGLVYAVKSLALRDDSVESSGTVAGAVADAKLALEFLEGVEQLRDGYPGNGRYLAPIYASGTTETGGWYATDYYPRKSLREYIERHGAVESKGLEAVVRNVVAGCLALRRVTGRSHGNLKPSNVLLAGKPQSLRSSQLHLVDPRPVRFSLPEAGNLAPSDSSELIRQQTEKADLKGIGELILQLVEGRNHQRPENYRYPICPSRAWSALGKTSERWLTLCNRLLDPDLNLSQINLEALEGQPASSSKNTGLQILAVAAGITAVPAVIIAVLHPWSEVATPHEERITLRPAQPTVAGVEENEQTLAQLNEESPAERAYRLALERARQAFERKDYNLAAVQADIALGIKPNDPEAAQVRSAAQHDLDSQTTAAPKSVPAQENLSRSNVALASKKSDREAAQIKADTQREQTYQTALTAARSARDQGNWAQASQQADAALGIKKSDPEATQIKADAQREQTYQTALAAARSARDQGNWAQASQQADAALGIKKRDPEATQIKADAQREQTYQTALTAAKSARDQGNWVQAAQQANIALGIKNGDPEATQLKAQAQRERTHRAMASAGKSSLVPRSSTQPRQAASSSPTSNNGNSETTQIKAEVQRDPAARPEQSPGDGGNQGTWGQSASETESASPETAQLKPELQSQQTSRSPSTAEQGTHGQRPWTRAFQRVAMALGIQEPEGGEVSDGKAVAERNEAEYQRALNCFNQGDYGRALDLCEAHKDTHSFELLTRRTREEQRQLQQLQQAVDHGIYAEVLEKSWPDKPPFRSLVGKAKEEDRALQEATRKLAQGDYSFIKTLEEQRYKSKPPFVPLLKAGHQERDWLNQLERLHDTGRHQELAKRYENLPAEVRKKEPFVRLTSASDPEATLAAYTRLLADWEKTYLVSRPPPVSIAQKTFMLGSLSEMESAFKKAKARDRFDRVKRLRTRVWQLETAPSISPQASEGPPLLGVRPANTLGEQPQPVTIVHPK